MKMGSSCFYADILLFPGQCFIVNLFVCCLRYSFMRMFAYVPWYLCMGHLQYFAITNNTTENTFIINFHFFPFIILKWYFFVYFQSSQEGPAVYPILVLLTREQLFPSGREYNILFAEWFTSRVSFLYFCCLVFYNYSFLGLSLFKTAGTFLSIIFFK